MDSTAFYYTERQIPNEESSGIHQQKRGKRRQRSPRSGGDNIGTTLQVANIEL
jgi:hypothetical protein